MTGLIVAQPRLPGAVALARCRPGARIFKAKAFGKAWEGGFQLQK
jgi:hypothetical protein